MHIGLTGWVLLVWKHLVLLLERRLHLWLLIYDLLGISKWINRLWHLHRVNSHIWPSSCLAQIMLIHLICLVLRIYVAPEEILVHSGVNLWLVMGVYSGLVIHSVLTLGKLRVLTVDDLIWGRWFDETILSILTRVSILLRNKFLSLLLLQSPKVSLLKINLLIL